MSQSDSARGFSPRVVIAMILVGVFSLSGLTVLSAYAPDLGAGEDGAAHALSKSAIGFAGAVRLLNSLGVPTVVSRTPLEHTGTSAPLRILTPDLGSDLSGLDRYDRSYPVLMILPKWRAAPDPLHAGWVRKLGPVPEQMAVRAAILVDKTATVTRRTGASRPVLRGGGGPLGAGTVLPLGPVDQLQTLSGAGWIPVLVDENGAMVAAQWKNTRLVVLADPDLLNNQGLRDRNTARAGLALLDAMRDGHGAAFDATLNGFKRGHSFLRAALEPPLLGATLCAVAAALLMGAHAAVRFGPAARAGRALALGKRALIDNSAELIRAAGREHELAPAYGALTESRALRAAGERPGQEGVDRLERMRPPTTPLSDLTSAAGAARSRAATAAIAVRLFQWRSEMTRDRR